MQERKRLHVTPLNSALFPLVLPQTLLPHATNISFHTLETFPDKPFGYFDLPAGDADKLRRKLNGCLLKGQKMKVEEARTKKPSKSKNAEAAGNGSSSITTRSKDSKGDIDGIVRAISLPDGRQVKRGWTEAESTESKVARKSKEGTAKKQKKKARTKDSTITGETECLFKTKIPPNALADWHDKGGRTRKRKRNGDDRETVVHEFKHMTKYAGFLRDTGSSSARQTKAYAEDRGWVDENDNVIEKGKKRRNSIQMITEGQKQPKAIPKTSEVHKASDSADLATGEHDEVEADETSSSGTFNSGTGSEDESPAISPTDSGKGSAETAKKTKGLGIISMDDNELENGQVERLSISRSSSSPVPHVETQATSAPSIEVHPLEALFKRPKTAASQTQTPKKPQLEVSTSFNFFDPDATETGSTLVPQTPFTQQDFRHRRQRSAAPTPDTALPGKTFGDVWGGRSSHDADSDDKDNEEQANAGAQETEATGGTQSGKSESDFAKWFWEHRGENNRAWKRRRREAAKEQRVKEKNEERA